MNFHVQGLYIEFDRYQPLIQHAARAVGISSRYFDELYEFSTILNAERYVRVDKNESGPVLLATVPIAQLSHLLENDRTGRCKLVQYDSGKMLEIAQTTTTRRLSARNEFARRSRRTNSRKR